MAAKNWVFTLNNYNQEMEDKLKSLYDKKVVKYLVYGREVAPTTNTPHLQGFIQFISKIRLNSIKKQVDIKEIYLDKCKNVKASISYCKKDGQVVEYGTMTIQGQRFDIENVYLMIKEGKTDLEIQEQYPKEYAKYYQAIKKMRNNIINDNALKNLEQDYSDVNLRRWQIESIQVLDAQDDRKILWILDEEGGQGKTWLAKYLIVKRKAYYCNGGKVSDILFGYENQEYVVFDYTRDKEDYVNYSVIEMFKNGLAFSSKYESCMRIFKYCKVIIFSNFWPDQNKLSYDRWNVVNLGE